MLTWRHGENEGGGDRHNKTEERDVKELGWRLCYDASQRDAKTDEADTRPADQQVWLEARHGPEHSGSEVSFTIHQHEPPPRGIKRSLLKADQIRLFGRGSCCQS